MKQYGGEIAIYAALATKQVGDEKVGDERLGRERPLHPVIYDVS